MFNPPPSVADVSSLFSLSCLRHYRRSNLVFVIRHRHSTSTFLRPLAPRALPRFLATTDALTPAGRLFGPCGPELRSGPGGSPCLSRTHVQPFCSQPLHRPSPGILIRSRFRSARVCQPADPVAWQQQRECFPSRSWPGLRNSARRLAGRCSRIGFTLCLSRCYGRVVHLRQLSTPCYHDAVAFSYRRVNDRLTGTSTPLSRRLHRRTIAAFMRQEPSPSQERPQGSMLRDSISFLPPEGGGPVRLTESRRGVRKR